MLSKHTGLPDLEKVVKLEQLMEPDKFTGMLEHVLLAMGLEELRVEAKNFILCNFLLHVCKSVVICFPAHKHVPQLLDVKAISVSFLF